MRRLLQLYALSGALSLGYQVVWMRHFVDRFGSSTFTFVLVICSFIAGLSAGALASGHMVGLVRRAIGNRGELAVYGCVEILVAATVLLTYVESVVPLDVLGAFPYLDRGGIHEPRLGFQLARVPLAALSVFVPCFFMGVTYPFLCGVFADRPRFPSRLYAWNTLGACSAVLFSEWVLLRYAGTTRTLLGLIAANAALGLLFLVYGERLLARCRLEPIADGDGADVSAGGELERTSPTTATYGVLLAGAVVSGFLSGALEADAFRRVQFVQISNGSAMAFVSFWAIAAIFLGSLIVHRTRSWSLRHVKITYALGLAVYFLTTHWVLMRIARWFVRATKSAWFGSLDPDGALTTSAAVLLATGLATFPFFLCISVMLPHVCNVAQRGGRHLGVLYGLNTVAFLAGMVAFSWLAPAVDMFFSFKLCSATFAVLVGWVLLLDGRRPLGAWRVGVVGAALAAVAVLTPAGFDPDFFPPGSQLNTAPIRALKGSPSQTTFVAELREGDGIFLGTNQMSGTSARARQYMALMAHFPLLAHPDPEAALLICFGAGNTASAIAQHSSVERIDVVDLSRNMLETASEFEAHNDAVHLDPRVCLIHDDGRNFLNVTDRSYDLITSEPPPPLHPGICRLYSAEYYRSVVSHLTPRGLMTQWLPIRQMPPAAGRLIVSTFVRTFPHALLLVGSGDELVLVGSVAPIELENVYRRFGADEAVTGSLHDVMVPTPAHLLARIVMPDSELRRLYGQGRIITDQENRLSAYWVTGRSLVFPYSPDAVLDAVGPELLEAQPRLRAALTDLVELQTLVPDYPLSSLAAARAGRVPIAGTDIDWEHVATLNREGHRAIVKRDSDLAWERFSESQAIVWRQVDVFLTRGWLLTSLQRHSDAVPWFRRAARQFPEYQEVHFGLAAALAGTGETERALEKLQTALELNPRYIDALLLMGQLLESAGRRAEALQELRRALEIKPTSERVRAALERVSG